VDTIIAGVVPNIASVVSSIATVAFSVATVAFSVATVAFSSATVAFEVAAVPFEVAAFAFHVGQGAVVTWWSGAGGTHRRDRIKKERSVPVETSTSGVNNSPGGWKAAWRWLASAHAVTLRRAITSDRFRSWKKGSTTVLARVFRQVGEVPLENLVQLVNVVLDAPLCRRERAVFAAILLGHRRRALISIPVVSCNHQGLAQG
jgi:hypothetical protein